MVRNDAVIPAQWEQARRPDLVSTTSRDPHPSLASRHRDPLVRTNRMILEEHLAGWGVVYARAASGPDGVQMLRDATRQGTPFELVILDMHMPEMDGLAVARAVKADPSIRFTRLLILTSGYADGNDEDVQQLGICGWLTRGLMRDRLPGRRVPYEFC